MSRIHVHIQVSDLDHLSQEIRQVSSQTSPLNNPQHYRLARRYLRKLQAIQFLAQGQSREEVMAQLEVSEGTLLRWINQWNKGKFDRLKPRGQPGRGPKVGDLGILQLERELDQSPTDFGYREDAWSTRLVLIHIARKHHTKYHLTSIYKLLRRLGFGLRTPYPEDPRKDENAMQAFQDIILPSLFKKKRNWRRKDS